MKEKNQTKEKWIRMKNIMNKVLKFIGIICVVILAVSLIAGFLGFLTGNEFLFNAGLSFLIFVLPACFVVFLLVLLIAAIIEDKSK